MKGTPRWAIAAVAAVVILVGGCDGSDSNLAAGSSGPLTAENAAWQPVALPQSPESIMSLAHSGTDFYLLTSSRGRPVLMRSVDGADWEEIPAPAMAPGGHLRHIAATSQILVLVGSESSPNGGTTVAVFTSIEGGPWIRSELPVDDIAAPGRPFNIYTDVNCVAVTPSGFAIAGAHGPASGARPMIWTSVDALDWEAEFDSVPPLALGFTSYATTGALQAILTSGEMREVVWLRSGDGWTRPGLEASLEALTVLSDQLFVAGTDLETGEPGIWATSDGVTWVRRAVTASEIREFSASQNGIAAIASVDAGDSEEAILEVGDLTVRTLRNGRFQVLDAAGSMIAEAFGEDVVQGDELVIDDPETGEILVEIDRRQISEAWQRVFQAAAAPEGFSLVVSRDGDSWTALRPPDPSFEPFMALYGNHEVLVSGWSEQGGPQLFLIRPGS
jgi:hypothetical protein